MTNIALTPTVWMTLIVEDESCKLAASDLIDLWHFLAFNISTYAFRIPKCLGVVVTGLAIDAETPCVKVSLVCNSGCVTESSRARLNSDRLAILVRWEAYLAWQFHNLLFTDSKLAHSGLSPSIHLTTVNDCQRIERSCCNVLHIEDTVFLVEEFDEGW